MNWMVAGLSLMLAAGSAVALAQTVAMPGAPVPAKFEIGVKPGDPLANLPPGARVISRFGERPAFSPDGRKLAFLDHAKGDVFEYDIATASVRNVTGHAPHAGIFRAHYLHDGSLIFSAARSPDQTAKEARGELELYWMDRTGSGLLVPLGHSVFEGIAVSRETNRIAWATLNRKGSEPSGPPVGSTTLWVGEVVVSGKTARLANVRALKTLPFNECILEAQDFTPRDEAVLTLCYKTARTASGGFDLRAWSVSFTDGAVTNFPLPPQLYGELEGAFPDARRALVECGNDNKLGLDLCLLELKPEAPRYTRLTFAQDYGNYRYSNPVVSGDARKVAFQYGLGSDEPGAGRGILLMDLPKGF